MSDFLGFTCEGEPALIKEIGQDWQGERGCKSSKKTFVDVIAVKYTFNEKINMLKNKLFHSET